MLNRQSEKRSVSTVNTTGDLTRYYRKRVIAIFMKSLVITIQESPKG